MDDHKHLKKRVVQGMVTAALLTPPGLWWAESKNAGKDPEVSNTTMVDDAVRREITDTFQERFVDVTAGYNARDRKVTLSEEEQKLAKDCLDHYEMLAESRLESGFYGSLFLDKATGQTLLNIAGMDFTTGIANVAPDIANAFMSTTGAEIAQTKDALAFARKAEKICHEKTGHGVNYVTGHSLGAYLASFIAGTNTCKQAEYFLYDGPGIKTNTVKACAELSGQSIAEVQKNFRDRCYSFTITHNSYNTLGQQPGRALTINNDENRFWILAPRDHIYEEEFVKKINEMKTLETRTNEESSNGPGALTGLFLFLAALPFLPDIKCGIQKRSVARE